MNAIQLPLVLSLARVSWGKEHETKPISGALSSMSTIDWEVLDGTPG